MDIYRNVFFDLDRTLWNFEQNATETLLEIIAHFNLNQLIGNKEEFVERYNYYNDRLWEDYRAGAIKKTELRHVRFQQLFSHYNISDPALIAQISRFFLNENPSKKALMPGAVELLEYLSRKYRICIISNGFHDVQLTKIISSGISRYIYKVFTSDQIGAAKPSKEIYNYSVSSINARKAESIMIGDDDVKDIKGAQAAGIDQIYYNPEGKSHQLKPTYEVRHLSEITSIL